MCVTIIDQSVWNGQCCYVYSLSSARSLPNHNSAMGIRPVATKSVLLKSTMVTDSFKQFLSPNFQVGIRKVPLVISDHNYYDEQFPCGWDRSIVIIMTFI